MIRVKKQKRNLCKCINCGNSVHISPETVKEKTYGNLKATYVECPVCGERILKQLDTLYSLTLAEKNVKLRLQQRKGKKLSQNQKSRLQSIEKELYKIRLQLNKQHWDEIYRLLNQEEDEKTGIADQELTLGNEVTITEQDGERMNEHV